MPRSVRLLALVPAPSDHGTAARLTSPATARLACVALLTLLASGPSIAEAQGRAAPAASATPLHVAASRFDFLASGDAPPPAKPLAVHNGGTARLTDVRLTRLAHADSAREVPEPVAIAITLVVTDAGAPGRCAATTK